MADDVDVNGFDKETEPPHEKLPATLKLPADVILDIIY
jgi:hypothetical protein